MSATLFSPLLRFFLFIYFTDFFSSTNCLILKQDYYTVHGDDAMFAVKEIYHSMSVVKYFGSGAFQLQSWLFNGLLLL